MVETAGRACENAAQTTATPTYTQAKDMSAIYSISYRTEP